MVDVIQHVFAPIFVIHGKCDTEIAVIHGKILSRLAPNSYEPWFVENAGHNDIEVRCPQELFYRINKFIKYLRNLEIAHIKVLSDMQSCVMDEEEKENYSKKMNKNIKSSVKNIDGSVSPPPPSKSIRDSRDIVQLQESVKSSAVSIRKHTLTIDHSMIDEDSSDVTGMRTPSMQASLTNVEIHENADQLLSINSSIPPSVSNDSDHESKVKKLMNDQQLQLSNSRIGSITDLRMVDDGTVVHSAAVLYSSQEYTFDDNYKASKDFRDTEEEDEEKVECKKRKKGKIKRRVHEKYGEFPYLVLPSSTSMRENARMICKRRDEIIVESDYGFSSDERDDHNIVPYDDLYDDEDEIERMQNVNDDGNIVVDNNSEKSNNVLSVSQEI